MLKKVIGLLCRWCCWLCRCKGSDKNAAVAKESDEEVVVVATAGKWGGVAGVAAGTKHIKATPPVPCQDAAIVRAGEGVRPCIFVADGAGSASLSHFGAQETVLRLSHFAASMEDMHIRMLDAAQTPPEDECRMHARRFLIHASETVGYLAQKEEQPFKEFRCTLLAVIIGAERVFWIKLGDGHIIREKSGENLEVVGPLGKGDYANVTNFIQPTGDGENPAMACGLFPAAEISGIAVMTDGAAEKLVSADGQKVAGRINTFLTELRQGAFEEKHLQKFLTDTNVWKPPGYTGDDKGIGLLSRIDENPTTA